MANGGRVNSFCKMCPTGCGITAEVVDGRATKVGPNERHPFNKLCPKSMGLLEVTYSEERITRPMKRIHDKWKEIDWDEAFEYIGNKLTSVKNEFGARSLAFHLGTPFIGTLGQKMARRFADVYGSPNYTSGASYCYYSRTIGCSLTFDYGIVNALPSFRGTKCILIWGANPKESSILQYGVIQKLKTKGSKIIVIDPRKIELAANADIYAQIRPGTDVFLALSLINVIIEENLYDGEFVKKWTTGFDQLVERAKEYPPEKAEKVTWVPASKIREIARMYAGQRPSCIAAGISHDHSTNGVQSNRALAILMAISGNVDVDGGNMWAQRPSVDNLRVSELAPDNKEGVGREYPLFTKFSTEQTMVSVLDALVTDKPYPIKALVVQGSNPMLTFPDTGMTGRALQRLDFLVVIDLFMTDTAKLADIFLPAAFALESEELKDYSELGVSLLAIGEKAIEPVGQSLPDWTIWAELGRRMGYQEYFPWKRSEELIARILKPSGLSIQNVREGGGAVPLHFKPQRYLNEGFNTPSGKVEIYSATMKKHGYDPLPAYTEPFESPANPELGEKYPFILISGARSMAFTHSQHRNIPSMLRREPKPVALIHTATAARLGISDGRTVNIESPRGSIRMEARITESIHPDVVSVPHGWAWSNVNMLTGGEFKMRDRISAYPAFRTGLCRVAPA